MTLQELRNYIKSRYATDASDVEIDDHINEVYRDIYRIFTPDTTEEYSDAAFVTVSEQPVYELPKSTRSIKQVHITPAAGSRTRLRSMKEDALLYPRLSGTPIRWYPYGFKEAVAGTDVVQKFGLDPIPDTAAADGAIHVLYEPSPDAMADNDDSPTYIPEEMHYLIAWGALAVLAGKQEDYNQAQHWDARYRNAYNEALVKLGKSRHANFPEAARSVKG